MLLGAELDIGHDPSQHTAYIKSWIRVLEDEPLEIFRASADAEKIINHLCALEQTQDIQLTELIEIKDDNLKEEVFMTSENTTSERVWLSIPSNKKR